MKETEEKFQKFYSESISSIETFEPIIEESPINKIFSKKKDTNEIEIQKQKDEKKIEYEFYPDKEYFKLIDVYL